MTIQSRFLKLLVGPVVTLFVGVASGPLITHLFSPEAFGFYASMLGLVGIAVAITTLRFDQLTTTSGEPEANFWLVLIFSFCGSLITLALSLFFLEPIWAVFVAAMTLLSGVFSGLYYLTLKKDQPLRSSAGRAFQSTNILAGQVGLGWLGWGLPGLALGDLLGRAVGIAWFWQRIDRPALPSLRATFCKQWSTAKWLIPGSVLGSVSLQVLPLGMVYSVGATSAGIFLMVYRMLAVPNTLVSRVAADTLLVELHATRTKGEELSARVEGAVRRLIIVALCLYGSVAIFGGTLFQSILGQGWEEAGDIVPILAIFVGCWSVASPLASVFVVLERTLWSTIFGVLDITNRTTALVIGAVFQDLKLAAAALASGAVVVYGFSTMVALCTAQVSLGKMLLRAMPSLLVVTTLLSLSWFLFQIGSLFISVSCAGVAVIYTLRSVLNG